MCKAVRDLKRKWKATGKALGLIEGLAIGLEENLANGGAATLFIGAEDKEIVKRKVVEQLSMIKKSVQEIYSLLVGSEETTKREELSSKN